MSNWIPVVITKKGLALQAKVEAGTVLKFTKMALGSGKPPDLATATALASLKQNLAIASKDVNNNTCVVYATGTNIGVTTAYQASELGLYAQDPDEGEILYAVTTDDTPDTVPSNSSATVITQRIGLAVAVSASSTVSVVLSTTGFITAADAENIANDVMTAHKTKTPLDHPAKSVQEKHLADGAVSTRALSKTGVAAGTYKSVTVDVKGRVTGGTNPTTLGGFGITDAYPKSTSDARYLPIAGKAVDAEKADNISVTNLGNFKGKTIGELKTALKNWIISSTSVVKMCSFGGVSANSIINWDSENTIIADGIIWTATTIAANQYKNYNRILISSYYEPLFVAILWNGNWSKLLEIPLKGNLISSINGVSTIAGGAINIPNATRSQSGVMSAADKTKLDGIEANANKYTLPPAGASVLGGIKVGAHLGISNGVLSGTYTTATTSAAGLLPKLSGNANDVMTGTGAWWNRAWRQAYSGTFATVGGVVCTLPANWVEVYLTASTFGSSGLENSGIYSKSDQGKELEYGRGQCELQFKINSNNQVVLNSIGAGGDGVVRGVYYR